MNTAAALLVAAGVGTIAAVAVLTVLVLPPVPAWLIFETLVTGEGLAVVALIGLIAAMFAVMVAVMTIRNHRRRGEPAEDSAHDGFRLLLVGCASLAALAMIGGIALALVGALPVAGLFLTATGAFLLPAGGLAESLVVFAADAARPAVAAEAGGGGGG